MRSYGQYCGLAKALDVIGDRWSLLIVRELLVGPRRYGELLDGLPGIATNLLADRLRELRAGGVLERDGAGSYVLTKWGQGLAEPLYALGRWATPLMGQMAEGETFRGHWLLHPVKVLFGDRDPRRADVTIEVRADGSPMTIQCDDGSVTVRPGAPAAPDVMISGRPDIIVGLLAGRIDVASAIAGGVHLIGDTTLIRKLRPQLDRSHQGSST